MGWFGTILGALYLLLLFAALAAGDIGFLLMLLSPFLAIGLLLVVLIPLWPLIRWLSRRRARAAYLAEYGERDEANRQGRIRLAEAFRSVVEYQHELDQRLLEWMREQARTTDKPEYRKVLKEKIAVRSKQDVLGDFERAEANGFPDASALRLWVGDLPDYYLSDLKPGEYVDRSDWERKIRFMLYRSRMIAAPGDSHCLAALDLVGARRILEYSLRHSLRRESLSQAVRDLNLDRGPCRRLIAQNPCPGTEILHYER